ncbi:MAG: hypothetical protein ACTHVE_07855 [Senegalia sp. (in: firmicutes)]
MNNCIKTPYCVIHTMTENSNKLVNTGIYIMKIPTKGGNTNEKN